MFKWYLEMIWKIWVQPILFYTRMPAGDWADEPLTFCGINTWILAFFTTVVVFINQLIPIGATLLVQVHGLKIITAVPVIVVLAFMFFVIVISILGGVFMALFFSLFYILGALLYLAGRWLGGKGEFFHSIKAVFYTSAVLLVGILPVIMVIFTKQGILDFTNFKIGYNIVYSFAVLYLYGLLAIAARKTQGLSRSKAFVAALLPVLLLVLVGLAMNKVILPRIANWIV